MKSVLTALFAGIVACGALQPISAANAVTFKEKVLYAFCSQKHCTDGRAPGSLIEVNGVLYGTTGRGGREACFDSFGCGTVFSLDPNTGAENVLYAFCHGVLSRRCTDGAYPDGDLINVGGVLYGTTSYGGRGTGCGKFGCGAVFSIDPNTGIEKTLYSFAGGTDGQRPVAGLIAVNGVLYGTTQYGGGTGCTGSGCGTVFSLDPNTGAEKVLYTFCSRSNCADGLWPMASLIAANGMLYGTTVGGGRGVDCGQKLGCGTIFSLDPVTGAQKVHYAFCSQVNCADGAGPNGLIAVNGILYGTTYEGGSQNCSASCGTVFSFDPGTGAETVLHTFLGGGTDGQWSSAGLVAVKGKLYGNTSYGGANSSGTVFSVDLKSGAETVVYSFCSQESCADGETPRATLIDVAGKLYGTTSDGGSFCRDSGGCGTVFVLERKR